MSPLANLTPVVRILLFINIGVFIAVAFMPGLEALLSVYYPTSPKFSPYQILTHMFTHHGLSHILFNMFGLISFGPLIERVWGAQKFLFFYLFCGLGALALQFGANYWQIQNGSLPIQAAEMIQLAGASGCLFGLLVAFAMLYPDMQIGLIFIPIYVKAKYAVPAYAALELFLGFGNYQQGVAHFAHIGGALAGFLLIVFWWKGVK